MMRSKFAIALTGALLLCGTASARDYIASGFNGGQTGPQPQAQAPIYGKVTQTGSAPATIMIPERVAQLSYDFKLPIPSASFFQSTRMGENYNQAGTFSSGGGPGSFSWCQKFSNTVNPNCLFPAQATGNEPQRITYTAGPNQFGGTVATIRNFVGMFTNQGGNTYNGFATARQNPNGCAYGIPSAVGLPRPCEIGGGGDGTDGTRGNLGTIGGIAYGLWQRIVPAPKYTYGAILGPLGTIQTPGKIVGTGTANAGSVLTGTEFGFTTGTVSITQYDTTVHVGGSGSTPTYNYYTLTGYDNRTALGAGNIQLVAGGVGNGNGNITTSFPVRRTWTMTLAEKVPTMSPAGFAAAAALMILAVGFAFRKRL